MEQLPILSDFIKVQIPEENKFLTDRVLCRKCNTIFTERNNIGTWNCFQHAFVEQNEKQKWPCCNKIISSKGCVECDHNTSIDLYNNQHNIKIKTANYKGKEAAICEKKNDDYIISRYNVEKEKRVSNGKIFNKTA